MGALRQEAGLSPDGRPRVFFFFELEEFSSCFIVGKLWWLEMVNFVEVLEDNYWFLGCGGSCHCQFGTDFELVE